MPTYTLTCQLTDSAGQVRAVRQVPFVVLSPDQLLEEAAADLQQAAKDLQEAAADLEQAAHDESHPKHHWWYHAT